jgi:DNA-binding transcriptional MerR regulator
MKIGGIKDILFTKYDLDIDINKIRRLEKMGLFGPARDKNNFRTYDESIIPDVLRVLLLSELGISAAALKNKDKQAVEKRIACIKKILGEVEKEKTDTKQG